MRQQSFDGTALLWGAVIAGGLFLLAKDPQCPRGCKTTLEHLASHAIQDSIDAFFLGS